MREKREYILPVKFDNTKIPGLPSTVGYLDASKLSPLEVAKEFAKKYGFKEKNRWWGIWEKESYSDSDIGTLFIYDVSKKGFFFNLDVMCGAHTGELEKRFAKFINPDKATFIEKNESEKCIIEFYKLNTTIKIQEKTKGCLYYHGLRAFFEGIYQLRKDVFYLKDYMTDEVLSKIYKQLGKNYECFEKCFHDIWEKKKGDKQILYGTVPGFATEYSAILIIENENVRGSFLNVNDVYWFASDNIIDEEIKEWIKNFKKGCVNFKKVVPFKKEELL